MEKKILLLYSWLACSFIIHGGGDNQQNEEANQ